MYCLNFNDDYCYSLRRVASLLISSGKTGYMLSERNLTKPDSEWVVKGIPNIAMMNMEKRSEKKKPVIQKFLFKLDVNR